jgi:hypothetical protein
VHDKYILLIDRKDIIMKKKFAVFVAMLVMALSIVLFAVFYQARHISTVSAEPFFNKLPTVTPYATSMPSVSVHVLQNYAKSEILTSSAHGFEVSAANFRVENNEIKADVCHQNPNNREWTIGEAFIQSGAEKIYITAADGLELASTSLDGQRQIHRFREDGIHVEYGLTTGTGEDNYRCDTLIFRLSPGFIVSHIKLTIEYIRGNLYEGEWCYENREAVQSILDAKGAHIKIDCSKNDGSGQSSSKFIVVEKSNAVSQEEAMKQVTDAFSESLIIKGPWVFQGEVINITEPTATDEPLATESPTSAPEETATSAP